MDEDIIRLTGPIAGTQKIKAAGKTVIFNGDLAEGAELEIAGGDLVIEKDSVIAGNILVTAKNYSKSRSGGDLTIEKGVKIKFSSAIIVEYDIKTGKIICDGDITAVKGNFEIANQSRFGKGRVTAEKGDITFGYECFISPKFIRVPKGFVKIGDKSEIKCEEILAKTLLADDGCIFEGRSAEDLLKIYVDNIVKAENSAFEYVGFDCQKIYAGGSTFQVCAIKAFDLTAHTLISCNVVIPEYPGERERGLGEIANVEIDNANSSEFLIEPYEALVQFGSFRNSKISTPPKIDRENKVLVTANEILGQKTTIDGIDELRANRIKSGNFGHMRKLSANYLGRDAFIDPATVDEVGQRNVTVDPPEKNIPRNRLKDILGGGDKDDNPQKPKGR